MRGTSLVALLLATAACVAGAEKRPGTLATWGCGFANGIFVDIALVAEPPDYKLQFSGGAIYTSDGETFNRVIADVKGQAYFGYDLTVERVPGTARIRVRIDPLSLTTKQLNSSFSNITSPADYTGLRFLVLPKYPPPQIVESGDTIALDLLVSPDGRQKAVDYLEITEKSAGEKKPSSKN
jgi:hypothetical protein